MVCPADEYVRCLAVQQRPRVDPRGSTAWRRPRSSSGSVPSENTGTSRRATTNTAEPRTPQLGERGVLPVVGPDAVHPGMEREQGGARDRVLQPGPGHPPERRGRARKPLVERADPAPVGEDRGSIQVQRLGIRATLLTPPRYAVTGQDASCTRPLGSGAVGCGPGRSDWDLRRCAAGPLAHHPVPRGTPELTLVRTSRCASGVRRYPCGCMHSNPSRSMSSDARASARMWRRARERTRGCA